MNRTWATAILVVVALCVIAQPAAAQDPEEPMKTAAKALYNEARQARKAEDFPNCYAKATAAWAIHKHPSIAALAGDCGVGVGKYRDAAEKIRAYFDDPTKVGSPDLQAHLESRLVEAKRHIAVVTVKVSVTDAACDVDGKRVEKLPATLFLEPGAHNFEARKQGHETAKQQVTVTAGQAIEVNLTLTVIVAQPVPQPKPKPEPGIGFLVGAGISGAVTAAGLGVMIAAAVLHGGAQDDVTRLGDEVAGSGGDSGCAGGGAGALTSTCSDLAAAIDDQNSFAGMFPVGLAITIVGAAATTAFVVLHFTSSSEEPVEAALALTPTGFSLNGRF